MRKTHEAMIPSEFPYDLTPLWGQSVRVRANITHRSIIEVKDKSGKSMRMPVLETTDVEIKGYDHIIPQVVVMSPAFWKSKAKTMDMIEFDGIVIKEKSKYVGFRMIKNVKVIPMQLSLL